MSKRFDWESVAAVVIALVLVGAIGYCVFMAGKILFVDRPARADACTTALDLAERRLDLTESNVALTLDAWAADAHDDTQLMEYANAGIATNHDQLADIESEYEEAKQQCQNK